MISIRLLAIRRLTSGGGLTDCYFHNVCVQHRCAGGPRTDFPEWPAVLIALRLAAFGIVAGPARSLAEIWVSDADQIADSLRAQLELRAAGAK
jgi:hypothetical protein